MRSSSWLLLSVLSCHIPAIEGLFFWRPSSAFTKQQIHVASLGEYILQAFDGPGTPEPRQGPLPTIKVKRMAVTKRGNNFNGATAALPEQKNSVALEDDGTDFSYFSAVKIGSKGEKFWMLMDTGSPSSWVMGADCTAKACTTHTTFGDKDSGTLKTTQEPFTIQYGTGNVSGVVISDTMDLADISLQLSFGSATTVSDHFINNAMDGIIGLGRPKLNSMGVPIFMEVVGEAKLLPANLFGFNLQRASDGTNDGEINFGSPDITKYTGELSFTDTISDQLQWEIPVDDAIVNGVPCRLTGNSAIIDTGTSFMLLPPDDAKVLHAQIPGSQSAGAAYHIPCSTTTSVEVVFSKVAYSISPKDYIGAPIQGGGGLCQSQIIGYLTGGPDQWLLGDTFMKNVYTVFDMDNNRIGFGIKNPASSSFPKDLSTSASVPLSTKASSSVPLASSTLPSPVSSKAPLSTTSLSPMPVGPVSSSSVTEPSSVVASPESLPSTLTPLLPVLVSTSGFESGTSTPSTSSITASDQTSSKPTSTRLSTNPTSLSTAVSSESISVAAAFGGQGLWVIVPLAFLIYESSS